MKKQLNYVVAIKLELSLLECVSIDCGHPFSIQLAYVLNQSHGHWLFNDVLKRKITLSWQFKEEIVERIILDNKCC